MFSLQYFVLHPVSTHIKKYYFHFSKNESFAEYVSKGVSKNSIKDNSCKYYGIRDLTTDPTPNKESCNFYLGLLDQNSSDIVEKSCSSDDIVFDTR